MENNEEKYQKRMIEIQKKLQEPKFKKKVDTFLNKISTELNCDIELFFNTNPEVDDYEEYMDSDDFIVPRNVKTMKLGDFIDHISQEKKEYSVFIDPIYLKQGLNEINDVLMTTIEDKVIIVPLTVNKNK